MSKLVIGLFYLLFSSSGWHAENTYMMISNCTIKIFFSPGERESKPDTRISERFNPHSQLINIKNSYISTIKNLLLFD